MVKHAGLVVQSLGVRIRTVLLNCKVKNLALNIGDCVSLMVQRPQKAVSPLYTRRAIPRHVKEPRAPVDKSRVIKPRITGQIPQ